MTGTLFLLLLLVSLQAESSGPDSTVAVPEYKLLYEQGFYSEALVLLDSLLVQDTSGFEELHYFRAACLIAKGDTVEGARVFEALLDHNCGYSLDSLFTPPKILSVYRSVRSGFLCEDSLPAVADSVKELSVDTASVPVRTETVPVDSSVVPDLSPKTIVRSMPLPVHVSLGMLPAGGGQWYQRKTIRGAFIVSAQLAAVAGCIWSYNKRDSYFHDRYGWYDGNRNAYEKYTNYTRFGFTVFLGTYLYGIADYYLFK